MTEENIFEIGSLQMKHLQDMAQPEDLHPDLVPYVMTTKMGFPMLNHPLVQNLMHSDMMNRMMNLRYAQKIESLKKALENKDFISVIFIHERPYRLDAFVQYNHLFGDKYWKILGAVWVDTMNSWQSHDVWEMLWEHDPHNREQCMDEDERKFYAKLPKKIIAYRGVGYEDNVNGFSWTLDIKVARKFSRMTTKSGAVYRAEITKKNIFAYFSGRNESEIVVRPGTFQVRKLKGG